MKNLLFCLILSGFFVAGVISQALAESKPVDRDALYFLDDMGATHSLNTYQGKPILLHFWATWCLPCIDEMPVLNELQHQFPDLVILPLSFDSKAETISTFYDKHLIANLPVIRDDHQKAFRATGSTGLPASLLIDADGNVVYTHTGPANWQEKPIQDMINSLLATP